MNSNLVTGVLLFLGGIVWAVVARHYFVLTRATVPIIALPALVLTAAGLLRCGMYFLERLGRRAE